MQWIDSGDLMKLRFLHGFRKLISSHLCVCVYRELYYLSFVVWKIRYLQYYCQFNRVYHTIRRCVSMLYICKSYSKSTLTSHYEPDLNTVHHDFSCLFAQSVWFTWKICRCYMLKKGEKASLWQHTYFTLSFVMLSEKKATKKCEADFFVTPCNVSLPDIYGIYNQHWSYCFCSVLCKYARIETDVWIFTNDLCEIHLLFRNSLFKNETKFFSECLYLFLSLLARACAQFILDLWEYLCQFIRKSDLLLSCAKIIFENNFSVWTSQKPAKVAFRPVRLLLDYCCMHFLSSSETPWFTWNTYVPGNALRNNVRRYVKCCTRERNGERQREREKKELNFQTFPKMLRHSNVLVGVKIAMLQFDA